MDRKRVLQNGQWNLFKNLFVFAEIDESARISDVTFNKLDLWVQVHNVPLSCMYKECAELIGSTVGTFIEVSTGLNGEC